MADKVTKMAIKVDLGCHKCRKKIKKVLCKIPQIQDQTYDEKANVVKFTVVSCDPEKIKAAIRRKGGKALQCIEISIEKPPPPPLEPPPPPEPIEKPCCEGHCWRLCYEKCGRPKCPPCPSPPCKPCPTSPPPCKPCPPPPCQPCPPPPCKPCPPPPCPTPCPPCPPPPCTPCPPCPPSPCWEWCERPVCDNWSWNCRCGCGGYGRCYVNKCGYLVEENASGCTIM